MSYWLNNVIDLGIVNENSKHTVTFKAKQDIPGISNTEGTCSCTTSSYNKLKRTVSAKLRIGNIPKHITDDLWNISKNIRVNYLDGTSEYLTIKATVKRWK